jgi:hypothetical protein
MGREHKKGSGHARGAAGAAAAAGVSAATRSRSCQGATANFLYKGMTFVVRQNRKKSWFCEKCRSCYNLINLKSLRWIQTR